MFRNLEPPGKVAAVFTAGASWVHRCWAGLLLKDLLSSYHNKETILFTIDPDYCNLNYIP